MRKVWGVLLVVLSACGKPVDSKHTGVADGIYSPNNVTLIAPSQTRGTVSGQLLSTSFAPIKAATVTLNVGGPSADLGTVFTSPTDDQGNFSFTLVPGGATGTITMAATGFATARTTFFVPDAAGNVPINNANANIGPILLTATTGTFKVLVLDPTGRPAAGAKALLDVAPAASNLGGGNNGTFGVGFDATVVTATADAAGLLTFTGVSPPEELSRLNNPTAGSYTVTVAALQDSTGNTVSNGMTMQYAAASVLGNSAMPVLQLTSLANSNDGGLTIVGTNVTSLMGTATSPAENMLKPADAIYVVFNQSVEPSSVRVVLSDEYGKLNLGFAKTLSAGNNVLTIQPMVALTNGAEYNVAVRAVAQANQNPLYTTGYFFGGDPAVPFGPVTITKIDWNDGLSGDSFLDPGETINVYFNQPLGTTGANLGIFTTPQAYFAANIDGDVGVGASSNSRGETGYTGAGWDTSPREPVGGLAVDGNALVTFKSHYTTRWQINFAGAVPCYGVPCNSINQGTEITIAFSRMVNQLGNAQTLWGEPVTSDLKSNLATGPALPSP